MSRRLTPQEFQNRITSRYRGNRLNYERSNDTVEHSK